MQVVMRSCMASLVTKADIEAPTHLLHLVGVQVEDVLVLEADEVE